MTLIATADNGLFNDNPMCVSELGGGLVARLSSAGECQPIRLFDEGKRREIVVRVYSDPSKDIGMNSLTIFHYKNRLKIVTCTNRLDTDKALSL